MSGILYQIPTLALHKANRLATSPVSVHCSGRVASNCPVHLDIFAADVDLTGGVCLEAVTKQRGQGRVAISLLDASGASMPLTGVIAMLPELMCLIALEMYCATLWNQQVVEAVSQLPDICVHHMVRGYQPTAMKQSGRPPPSRHCTRAD